MQRSFVRAFALLLLTALLPGSAAGATWFVAAGRTGNGSAAAPFGRIQDGLQAAQPGDTVMVRPGTYNESLRTIRGGLVSAPIVLQAEQARGSVVVTYPGRVLRIDHPRMLVRGLVLDGQYAAADAVTVGSAAHFLTLTDVEVRRSSGDLIDMAAPQNVLVERSLIHHALNAAGGRTDAHGIAAGAVRNLTIRDTEIHTFSGDGLQVDPGRAAPGWDAVTLERVRIWLAPLPAPENGFAAGVVPGENAIDTKAGASFARGRMVIRDSVASGFRGGLINNMAAFNLKENVDVTVDRVTVSGCEIAFRLRGPSGGASGAWVTITNTVVHSTTTAYRYEDNIERVRIHNSTIGGSVTRAFSAASSGMLGIEVRNTLVLGTMPPEAVHPSNQRAAATTFVNANAHNYALVAGSLAIDAGIPLTTVTADRVGVKRPQGRGYDIGAYEFAPASARVLEPSQAGEP